ncbi:hypothetical protein PoB_003449300 [Plakobranchus ocellatus]|uniref:Uncharacterized protein n=1 Tax=Plakobranchus ocellatus TaxID=259542 RepID=A0AAV4AL05_9GAST|nr:hypothetical protein PoB_003449300 [Plakobranchus ocellatus]
MDYQVDGEDYTILEVDVSGNSSRYSFKKDLWPRFEYKARKNGKLSPAVFFCAPLSHGSCVTNQSLPNNCSCEYVGHDTFRLRANITMRSKELSYGQISLTWPGTKGPLRYDFDVPEVKIKPALKASDAKLQPSTPWGSRVFGVAERERSLVTTATSMYTHQPHWSIPPSLSTLPSSLQQS